MAGPGRHMFGDEERQEVAEVLASGHLSRYGDTNDQGFTHKVYSLEQEFAELIGMPHALAVNSGTSALLVALWALGIGEGDEVLVPGFTYVATMAAVLHARATPVLVEVDASLTIDPEDVAAKITPRSKAVIPVHMLGKPCKVSDLLEISTSAGLHVIEDCCQATGGSYQGRRLGSFGDIGVYSFNRSKILSAGEGGILTTSDDHLYRRAFALHDQGHSPLRTSKERAGPSLIGMNLKMNELTGAVALAQLRKIEPLLADLRRRKSLLVGLLDDLPGVTLSPANDQGECATILTLQFPTREKAADVARTLGTETLDNAGWHVYRHMEQIGYHRTASPTWPGHARNASPGDLPRTDNILSRSVNVSIGVVDKGLGAGFGANLESSNEDLSAVAHAIRTAVGESRQ